MSVSFLKRKNWMVYCRYSVDLVVCSAFGCDMFDCVYPTRTAVSKIPFSSHDPSVVYQKSICKFTCNRM